MRNLKKKFKKWCWCYINAPLCYACGMVVYWVNACLVMQGVRVQVFRDMVLCMNCSMGARLLSIISIDAL